LKKSLAVVKDHPYVVALGNGKPTPKTSQNKQKVLHVRFQDDLLLFDYSGPRRVSGR
jgi:hypothetical protein